MIGYAVAAYLVIGVVVLAYFIFDSSDSIEAPSSVLEWLMFFAVGVITVVIWPWPVAVALESWSRCRS